MSLVISLLVLLLVIYVVKLILDALELPANVKHVVLLIIGVIFLIVLLQRIGVMGNIGL